MKKMLEKSSRHGNPKIILYAVAAALAIYLFAGMQARADFAPRLNYQGRLVDANGVPVPDDAAASIEFEICTDGSSTANCNSTTVWTETNTVAIVDGLFSAILGGTSSVSGIGFNSTAYYIQITYDGDTYSPPQRITAAAMALNVPDASITSAKIANYTITSLDIQDGAVLDEISDNDGAGSGLDCDLLDGFDWSNVPAGTDIWVNESGDTMSGTLNSQDVIPTANNTYDLGSGANKWSELHIVQGGYTDSSVTSADILDGTIGSADIANGAVASVDIADGAVASIDIANGAVASIDIADGAVASVDIADGTIAQVDVAFDFISSLENVYNTGGNIDLIASTGIQISSSDAANTITFAASGSGIDHGLLSGLGDNDHPQYVLDAGDTMTGNLVMSAADIDFSDDLGDKLLYYGAADAANSYVGGIESGTLYWRANGTYRWYMSEVADGGSSENMELDTDSLNFDNKEAIRYSDSWLRLNQAGSFSSGVYTPGLMRADGGFNVDNNTVIDSTGRYHYNGTDGSTYYVNKWGGANTSGYGVDALNSGDWDFLVYEDNIYLQYNSTTGKVYIGGGGIYDYNDDTVNVSENLYVSGNETVTGDLYGRSVNGQYSQLYRWGGIYFTWDSDSYGTNFNHSITSTENGTYGDNLTMNSYGSVDVNIDSNSNGTDYFRINHHTTGTANNLLTVDESGNLSIAGNFSAGSYSTLDGRYVNVPGDTMTGTLVMNTSTAFQLNNGAIMQAKNTGGSYETFLWPRWTNNNTYFNYGSGGNFYIRNNASANQLVIRDAGIDIEGGRVEDVGDPNSGDDAMDRDYADARYVNVTGDTMTGRLEQASTGFHAGTKDNITTRTDSGFYQTSTATTAEGWPVTSNNWYHLLTSTHTNDGNYYSMQFASDFFDSANLYYRSTSNNGSATWYKIWHSGNDGSGSGLDADLVDGHNPDDRYLCKKAYYDGGTDYCPNGYAVTEAMNSSYTLFSSTGTGWAVNGYIICCPYYDYRGSLP